MQDGTPKLQKGQKELIVLSVCLLSEVLLDGIRDGALLAGAASHDHGPGREEGSQFGSGP